MNAKENSNAGLEPTDTCKNCGSVFIVDDKRDEYCNPECRKQYNNDIKDFDRLGRIPDLMKLKIPGDIIRTKIEDLKRSIGILSSMRIGREGLLVNIDELIKRDFNAESYSYRFSAGKSDSGYIVEFGPYVMTWESKDYVFIRIKTL